MRQVRKRIARRRERLRSLGRQGDRGAPAEARLNGAAGEDYERTDREGLQAGLVGRCGKARLKNNRQVIDTDGLAKVFIKLC